MTFKHPNKLLKEYLFGQELSLNCPRHTRWIVTNLKVDILNLYAYTYVIPIMPVHIISNFVRERNKLREITYWKSAVGV